MKKIGLIGYRGIVGNIIFKKIKKTLFRKKNLSFFFFGKKTKEKKNFYSERDYKKIFNCDIIIICKDAVYVSLLYRNILKKKWKGYLIDSSSFFREKKKSTLCLNPLNGRYIKNRIKKKKKIFCGGNCTVSLMMIALKNLFKKNLIKSIYCTTFQSISGAGYIYSNKIIKTLRKTFKRKINNFIELNKFILKKKDRNFLPLIPWIGTKKNEPEEELKGELETNIILKSIKRKKVKVFSNCVRVNSVRCHSQSIFLKTNKKISLKKFKKIIKKNSHIVYVKNKKKETLKYLNPNFVSGRKKIFVGRIKKIKKNVFSIFTIGDQLIWGASEPLFKTLIYIIKNNEK
ncbi:Aspartate-semialdehyde dehydrogenase [Candidatus Vidania fulgoroideae]|nr:Aspartate-semialdehyde dehydrogenase [Candidatus Vidania fulgoroideae]